MAEGDLPHQGEGRRRLLTFAVRDDDPGGMFDAAMDAQLAVIHGWWCKPDLKERAFALEQAPRLKTRRDVEVALHDSGLRDSRAEDAVVVYVTGHGRSGPSNTHYLQLPDTQPGRPLHGAFRTADFVTAALDSHAQHVLVIVNCCFAGALHAELARLRTDLTPQRQTLPTLGVFVTADYHEKPRVTEFAALLSRVDHQLRTTTEIATPYLTFEQFFAELAKAARARPALIETVKVWPLVYADQPSLCLPNPGYRTPDDVVEPERRQLAASAAELDYWLDRASGRPTTTDPGWYFSGRAKLTSKIATFLREEQGTLIVTGAAGTGKSALIARAVTLSDPAFRADARYHDATAAVPPQTMPPTGSIDVAVLARNKDTADIAEQIVAGLGYPSAPSVPGQSRIETIREKLTRSLWAAGERVTIVVDGLDEALSPVRVITDLLGPLARLGDEHQNRPVRLIIGVRSSTTPTCDQRPTSDQGAELFTLLTRAIAPADPIVVRTDLPGVEQDIAEYIMAILRRHGRTQDTSDRIGTASNIAHIVAAQVQPSFLDARIAAHQLQMRSDLPATDDPDWLASLAEGTVSLLRTDLNDVATPDHPVDDLIAVLRATALAQGPGIPWDEIWPAITQAVADRYWPEVDATIHHVLRSRLAGYLTTDVADSHIVRRPAHERLAEVLRDQPHRLHRSISPILSDPDHIPTSTVHRRITEHLLMLLPIFTEAPHPYLRRYLARHAALGHILDDHHVPASFLPWETSGQIRSLLGLPIPDHPHHTMLASWTSIEPFLADADPPARARSLRFAHLANRHQPPDALPAEFLHPRWARWALPNNVIAQTSGFVDGLAAFSGPDARYLLATGSADVRIWDPFTGTAVGEPLVGHTVGTNTSGVGALAAFRGPDGRTLLATGGGDGMVWIWDPLTGTSIGDPLTCYKGGLGDGVREVAAFSGSDGRAYLAVNGWDGTVGIWNPVTGAALGPLPASHAGVNIIAVFSGPDGRALLATGHGDGTVRIWNPVTRTAVGEPLAGHTGGINGGVKAIAAFSGPGGRSLLATGGGDATVRIWDPLAGTAIGGPLIGHTKDVRAIAVLAGSGGRTFLATFAEDRTARIWDPITRTAVGESRTGYIGSGCIAAIPGPDGRTLLATASLDKTVRIWDPLANADVVEPQHHWTNWAWAVTTFRGPDGRALLAVSGDGDTVQIWDAATGAQVGDPLTGQSGSVTAITAFADRRGRILLATSSLRDAAVRIWDPATGRVVKELHAGDINGLNAITAFTGRRRRTLLAIANHHRTVQIWDPANGVAVSELETSHWDGVHAITAFTGPDGRTLLATAGHDGTVRTWDTVTGAAASDPMPGHTWVEAITTFTGPDGRTLLATGSHDKTVRIWDPAIGAAVGDPLTGHTGWIHTITTFSGPDGRALLATGSRDATVRIWDPAAGAEVARLVMPPGALALAVGTHSHVGRANQYLAVAGMSGIAVVDVRDLGIEGSTEHQ